MPISTSAIPADRKFERKLDPNGKLDYTVDWSKVLSSGDTVDNVITTLSALSIAAGLEIVSETNDDTTSTIRFQIASANRSDAGFEPPGTELNFKQNMTDSSGQKWEFSFSLRVVHQ